MRRTAGVLAVAVLIAGGAAGARADVLSPPPESCPEGSTPVECHGPPTCVVQECTHDDACESGACEARSLCVTSNSCGGMLGTPVYQHAAGVCGDGMCTEGTCMEMMVCVPLVSDASCGCAAPGASRRRGAGAAAAAAAAGLAVSLAVAWIASRRRRR